MTSPTVMVQDLRALLALARDMLSLVEREGAILRAPGSYEPSEFQQRRKEMLPRLDQALAQLKKHRQAWLHLKPEDRAGHQEVSNLLRQNQDVIMKIIVQDRENEQMLLRRGLLPARHLPSPQRQRPHFVAELYRRASGQRSQSI